MEKKMVYCLGFALASWCGLLVAAPTSYSGSLSAAGGGLVTGGTMWSNTILSPASLSWVVTNTAPALWHYEYSFTVPAGNIACFMLETSHTFTQSNLSSVTTDPEEWVDGYCIGTHTMTGNPGMLGDLYGIRFCSDVDPTTLVIEFNSNRTPVWGDFYAKGYFNAIPGGPGLLPNWAYNAGFMAADPLAGPHSGSELNHLLVPDSMVPAPGAVLLAACGVLITGQLRRRRVL